MGAEPSNFKGLFKGYYSWYEFKNYQADFGECLAVIIDLNPTSWKFKLIIISYRADHIHMRSGLVVAILHQ